MNVYENIVILNASLNDEEADTALSKIRELIVGNGGEVLTVDIWGRKRLSYEIKKQKKGLYILLLYKTPTATIKKLEDFYRVSDAVIKYLIIKLTRKQIRSLEKSESTSEQHEQQSVD
jgi:small subunit ribosomal protein S6